MCGIAGKFVFSGTEEISPTLLQKMCAAIRHRGPDDEGIFCDGYFGFGMRRLSIIDLAGGHQPIFNEDKSLAIVFNGEIYNYQAIMAELLTKGHTFTTRSDTETILHAYEEYGPRCLDYFNGMFAFAIWDSAKKELFIARDRIGIKPLFYYADNAKLVFGSELKAILQDSTLKRELNPEALDLFLSYAFIPAPYCIFKNMFKLAPGHYLVANSKGVTVKRYWEVYFKPDQTKSLDQFKYEFNELFEDAVKLRLLSEVPLGVFLSGGIDSSAIVAAVSKVSSSKLKTFSIGFADGGYYDETSYAKQIAQTFDTDHTAFKVGAEILNLLPKFSHHFDEPFADYAAFPTFVLSELTRKYVTVALSGDGGDELFAGYRRYLTESFLNYYQRVPAIIRSKLLSPLLYQAKHIYPKAARFHTYLDSAHRLATFAQVDTDTRYIRSFFKFYPTKNAELLVTNLVDPDFSESVYRAYIDDKKDYDTLAKQLYLDIKTSLSEDMLTKIDRTSMAHSLEVRVPFLDYRIVELAATIPSEYKIRGPNLKVFLKEAFADTLPKDILYRPKHGFTTPIHTWLRNDMQELVYDVLSEDTIKQVGVFEPGAVTKLVADHMTGRENNGIQVFMLLSFHMWYVEYMA